MCIASACFGKTAGVLIDDVLEIVDLLTGRVRDEHDVPALLPHIVCSIRTENCNPQFWFLDGCYCNACILNVMVETVIGERFSIPGLYHDIECLVEAGPLLPGAHVEAVELKLQIAGANPQRKSTIG